MSCGPCSSACPVREQLPCSGFLQDDIWLKVRCSCAGNRTVVGFVHRPDKLRGFGQLIPLGLTHLLALAPHVANRVRRPTPAGACTARAHAVLCRAAAAVRMPQSYCELRHEEPLRHGRVPGPAAAAQTRPVGDALGVHVDWQLPVWPFRPARDCSVVDQAGSVAPGCMHGFTVQVSGVLR